MKKTIACTLSLAFMLSMAAAAETLANEKALKLASPDESVAVTVDWDAIGGLTIEVTRDGQPVLEPSPIGVVVDGKDLGARSSWSNPQLTTIDETFPWRGNKSEARNHCNQMTADMKHGKSGTKWQLQIRAYDDGAAWRYLVPGTGEMKVTGESTAFTLPENSRAWCQTNTGSYEGFYTAYVIKRNDMNPLPPRVGMPVTVELPSGKLAMLNEADTMGYSGMSLKLNDQGVFESMFEDDPEGWTMTGPMATPWRVVLAVDNLNELANSTLIGNVCPAPDKELFPKGMNEPWIQPGRCLWQWWAYGLAGAQWDKQKWFVDMAAKLKCDYYLVDDGWENPKFGWMEGERSEWERMKELADYAKSKDVKLWIWRAWRHKPEWKWPGLDTPERREEFFSNCAKVGAAGVKIDFMNSESQDMLDFYRECLKVAAKHKIMVNFHGANKPAGEMRTWPNEMTREGILGLEYNKWIEIPRGHYTVLPFTRLVAGHGDFTPTTFQKERQKRTTGAHQLASAVVLSTPVLCWADKPDVYLEQPEQVLKMLQEMPTTWDETIVLPGSRIGQFAGFARRAGDEWWIGILNGTDQHMKYELALDFLPKGKCKAITVTDVRDKENPLGVEQTEWTSGQKVELAIPNGGGFVARVKCP